MMDPVLEIAGHGDEQSPGPGFQNGGQEGVHVASHQAGVHPVIQPLVDAGEVLLLDAEAVLFDGIQDIVGDLVGRPLTDVTRWRRGLSLPPRCRPSPTPARRRR